MEATMQDVKRDDDLVRLTNKTDEKLASNYNGSVYSMEPKGESVIRRDIAMHLIGKTSTLTPTGRVRKLEIVELPTGQRQQSPGEFPKLAKEVDALAQENTLLKQKIRELVRENESLDAEIKKLKKR